MLSLLDCERMTLQFLRIIPIVTVKMSILPGANDKPWKTGITTTQSSTSKTEVGVILKSKWKDLLEHRHRIMHGHPDAYFDINLATTALLFLGLNAYVAAERADDLM